MASIYLPKSILCGCDYTLELCIDLARTEPCSMQATARGQSLDGLLKQWGQQYRQDGEQQGQGDT